SGEFAVLSRGTTAQTVPAVSPDGGKIAFLVQTTDYDLVSVDLSTAAAATLIATQRTEEMPAWAMKEAALAYVTDRTGEPEIWLHKSGQPDRPLVTARDFPPDTTQWFMGPMLSPDATRIIYTRIERAGPARLWMSAVSGGAPVRLVKSDAEIDYAGSWSPDGAWFVYWNMQDGAVSLRKVKTTGQGEPEVLRPMVKPHESTAPLWSPAGDWILHSDQGFQLISPDGKTTRKVDAPRLALCTFSANGASLYCLRQE